ncbi:MAG: GntR family transcriptional regulator [Candidatus Enteromonas sp.]
MTKDIAPIYETLKKEIVTIQLKPGTRIREESVSERFGVSRTPVRDVLKKLEEDKLLTVVPKSGTFVTKLDLDGLTEIMYLRAAVETRVMIEIMDSVTPEQIQEFRDLLANQLKSLEAKDLSPEEFATAFYDVDNAFHHAIYRVADKESMLDLLENAFPYYQRYRYMTNLRDKADVSNLYRLHGELLDAFEAKDKKRLSEASRLHHFSGLNGLKKVMEKHPDYFIS